MKKTQSHIAKHYATMQIETASRQKRIYMLHEKCVDLIQIAYTKEESEKRDNLDKAQNILAQFQSALRIEDNVSQSLFYIYDYSYILLEKGDKESCLKAIQVMSTLRDTFKQLLRSIR